MADNTRLPIGTEDGDVYASDDIGDVKFQRVKLTLGADGVNDGDVASANPLPVSGTFYQATQPVSGPLTDAQLRATAVPVSGTVTASGPLTDTQLRATPVPVSGTVTASGPLTDTQLRATPVPVSGTVTASGPLTDTQLRATKVPVTADIAAAQTLATVTTLGTITNVVHVDDNAGSLTVDGTVGVSGTVTTKELRAATPAQSSVANSASSVTLLSSNSNRLGATIFNDDTAGTGSTLKVKLGATASATSFTVALPPQSYYEVPFAYTGVIDGIAAGGTGNARITELSA